MRHVTIVFLAVFALTAGCGGDDDGGGGSSAPDAAVASAADAAPSTTWTSFGKGFMETYCGACHGAGDSLRDYSLLSEVVREQGKIRCGVSPVALDGCSIRSKQFPIGNGPKPSDELRQQLVDWIDQGAAE